MTSDSGAENEQLRNEPRGQELAHVPVTELGGRSKGVINTSCSL